LDAPILDLACGTGRNGLFLAKQGLPVVFADRNIDALSQIAPTLPVNSRLWQVDLEIDGVNPLAAQKFSAIIVYRYLHRPILDAIKQAVKSGGIIIYETFTTKQAVIGRPKNPDFLLQPLELPTLFASWHIHQQFEGLDNGNEISQIVAQKN
jgi:SAM-dependent methyltransferase